MAIDTEKIEEHVRGLLTALGDDPQREGLKETPARVARMCREIFAGMEYTDHQIAELCGKTFEDDLMLEEGTHDMVVVRDIEFFSHCEHHLALMYNMHATVAYIPKKKVLGLSKIIRVVDLVGKRLQLQERIGSQIAAIMQEIAETEDVAVIIEGQHACITTRGIKNTPSVTTTTTFRGAFALEAALRQDLLAKTH